MPAVPLKPGIGRDLRGVSRSALAQEKPTARCLPSTSPPGRSSAVPRSTCKQGLRRRADAGPDDVRTGGDGRWRYRETRAQRRREQYLLEVASVPSRAVSGCKPKLDSISARLEQCSNGPSCTTGRSHQIGHHDGGHPEAELPVIRDELPVRRRGAVARLYDVGRVCVVDHPGGGMWS